MGKEVLWIFIGGGVGSTLRYIIQRLSHEYIVPFQFPWATFAVNIAGCFLIGLFYALAARLHFPDEIRLLLTTGLCGGFTTFSTFSHEGVTLLRNDHWELFALYTLLSIAVGIGAVFLGGYVGISRN